jgi:hypothetical protein
VAAEVAEVEVAEVAEVAVEAVEAEGHEAGVAEVAEGHEAAEGRGAGVAAVGCEEAEPADDGEAASGREPVAFSSHAQAAAPLDWAPCLPNHRAPALPERSTGLRRRRPRPCPHVPPTLRPLSTLARSRRWWRLAQAGEPHPGSLGL